MKNIRNQSYLIKVLVFPPVNPCQAEGKTCQANTRHAQRGESLGLLSPSLLMMLFLSRERSSDGYLNLSTNQTIHPTRQSTTISRRVLLYLSSSFIQSSSSNNNSILRCFSSRLTFFQILPFLSPQQLFNCTCTFT